jgi:hypothetical protein
MRLAILVIAAAAAGCAAPQPYPEARQAAELIGRTAGAPQRCVPIQQGSGLRIAEGDGHTLVYGSGRTIWASHLGPGCSFRQGDILIVEPFGSSSNCRGDIIRSMDAVSHMPGPSCVLGDFVPYSR